MKLKRFLVSGGCKLWLVSLVLGYSSLVPGATYTMSSSGDIPMVDGAYSFADGDELNVEATATNSVPIRLNGSLAITGSAEFCQTGEVIGSGDLHFKQEHSSTVMSRLLAPFSANGSLYVDQGVLIVTNANAIGTSTVYVNEETPSGKRRRLVFKNSSRSETVTVANALVLGTEDTAGWAARLSFEDGKYVISGPVTVNNTKINCQNGSLAVRGAITGNKLILTPRSNGPITIETAVSLTGAFWVGNGGKVYLNVPGCTFSSLYGFSSGTTLVLGGENYFPTGANFASQNASDAHMKLDLNGFSQVLGSFSGEGAKVKPFTIMNSKAGTHPTVTIRQTVDNATTNLHFSGGLDLVKEGASLLAIGSPVGGTITVRAGTLKVGEALAGDIAKKVVVDGGVLDLGGQRVSCRLVEIKGGGSVRNGTLAADRVVTDETAHLDNVTFAPDVTQASYEHPSGTVIHFPFDGSLTAAMRDATTNQYDLAVKSGTPAYSAEGRSGGCLYFDGGTILEVTPFPEFVPTGNAPYTVSLWAKADASCHNHGGWIGYGNSGVNGGSNNFRMNNDTFTSIWNYWWAQDIGATLPSGNFKDGWHHVVGTWDGTTRRLYCDGELRNSDSTYTPNFGNEQFQIGTTLGDANFTGWIDDVLIANRAFSGQEIATLYQDGGIGSTQSDTGAILDVSGGNLFFDSPAVHYPFNSSTTLLSDHSGHGADLHVAGGSSGTFSPDSPFSTGGSLYFDGSTWLEAAAFPASMPTGNMQRTIACFIKPATDCEKEGAIISWGAEGFNNTNTKYMNFALRQQGARFGLFPWGSDNVYMTCTKSDVLDHWNSFVAVWDGSQVSLYMNGELKVGPASYQNTSTLNTLAGGFKVGKAFYDGTSYYKGNMAELAVWSRVLTATEIASYHQFGAAGVSHGAEVVCLTGTGSVRGVNLTVTDLLDASLALTGDLTLADGVTVLARPAPTTVSGTLIIVGGGTVALPETCEPPTVYPLFTANALSGTANFADWTFANLPRGTKATIKTDNGAVSVHVVNSGMTVIFR